MKIGSLIKFHRTKQGMTQNELAMGICSIPHLSKIENNSKEGNSETLRLLLERLNIQLLEVKHSEQQISWLLNELQKHINYLEKEKAIETMERLKEYEEIIVFTNSIYLYELYKLRYYVSINNLELAENQLSWLNNNKQNFSQHEKYLHSYFSALVLLLRGKFVEANQALSKLLLDNAEFGVFEGEFYYSIAIVKGRLEETSPAIIYGKRALTIYKDQFNFKRVLYSLMSLAINYTRSKIYQEAIEAYEHLLRNVNILGQQHLLPQIYHNMGNLYQKKGEYANALIYFEKSLLLMPKDTNNYLYCLYNLALLQLRMNRYEDSVKNFHILKKASKQVQIFNLLAVYYLHLLKNEHEKALNFLEDYLIPYFYKREELGEIYRNFTVFLSEYYFKEGKYEKVYNLLQKKECIFK